MTIKDQQQGIILWNITLEALMKFQKLTLNEAYDRSRELLLKYADNVDELVLDECLENLAESVWCIQNGTENHPAFALGVK